MCRLASSFIGKDKIQVYFSLSSLRIFQSKLEKWAA